MGSPLIEHHATLRPQRETGHPLTVDGTVNGRVGDEARGDLRYPRPPKPLRPFLRNPTFSGASRTRTGDLLGAIQALSQLSYSPAAVRV
jgi:hypothetical protein